MLKPSTSPYEGVDLKSLVYLSAFNTIDFEKRKPVWEELFRRYFIDRAFNLYALFQEKDLGFFIYALDKELQLPEIQIPDTHLENFANLLMQFIEKLENKALQEDADILYSFGNLQGLGSFLQKFNKMYGTQNGVLVQKFNVWLEKNQTTEAPSQSLVVSPIKKANLKISKSLPVHNLKDMIESLHLYSEEEQRKIIQVSLAHKSETIVKSVCNIHPLKTFLIAKEMIQKGLEVSALIEITSLLEKGKDLIIKNLGIYPSPSKLDEFMENQTWGISWDGFTDEVRDFFSSLPDFMPEFWDFWIQSFTENLHLETYYDCLSERLNLPIERYLNFSLTDLLSEVLDTEIFSFVIHKVFVDRSKIGTWDFSPMWKKEPMKRTETVTRFEDLLTLYNQVKSLIESRFIPFKTKLAAVMTSWEFSEQGIETLIQWRKDGGIEGLRANHPSLRGNLYTWSQIKFEAGLTSSEIKLLYTTPMGYFALRHILLNSHNFVPCFGKYLRSALELYDFQNSSQLQYFFSMGLSPEQFFQCRQLGVETDIPDYPEFTLDLVLSKLALEQPQEYGLIFDYFTGLPKKEWALSPRSHLEVYLSHTQMVKYFIYEYFQKRYQNQEIYRPFYNGSFI